MPTATDPGRRLLDTAGRLFYEEGLHAVGIDRLLEEAGVAKATLYNRFGSKDALIAAYLEERSELLAEGIAATLDRLGDEAPPAARIRAVFDRLEPWMAEERYRGCPFLNASGEHPDPDHPVRQVVRAHRARLSTRFEDLAGGNARRAGALMMLYDGLMVRAQDDVDAATAMEEVHLALDGLLR